MKNIESNSDKNSLNSAWAYSTIFCVAVYFGWTFGLKYFAA